MFTHINKFKKHYIRLVIAILFLGIFLKWINIDDYSFIVKSFWKLNFWIGCGVLVVVQLIKTLRFQIFISEYDVRVDFLKNLLIHLIVPIMGLMTPAKLGEGAKLLLIGDKKEKVGFCFILEKLNDLSVLILLGTIGLYRYSIVFKSIYFVFFIIFVAIIILAFFDKIFNFIFKNYFSRSLEKNWFINNLKLFAKPKHLFALSLGIAVWALTIFAAYMFSLTTGAGFNTLSFVEFAPVYASCVVVGVVSGLPGGIGPREAAISLLFFQIFKIDIESGGIFSLLNLFGNYFIYIIIGIIGYAVFKKNYYTL